MSEPIKNCPVCGSKARGESLVQGFFFCCGEKIRPCGVSGPCCETEAEAIAVWNRIALRYKAHEGLVAGLKDCRLWLTGFAQGTGNREIVQECDRYLKYEQALREAGIDL